MHVPKYNSAPAPALLGFDESIDDYCRSALRRMHRQPSFDNTKHAENCVRANLNILALYGDRVPYNICRNLEWMVCAAKGAPPRSTHVLRRLLLQMPTNQLGPLYAPQVYCPPKASERSYSPRIQSGSSRTDAAASRSTPAAAGCPARRRVVECMAMPPMTSSTSR